MEFRPLASNRGARTPWTGATWLAVTSTLAAGACLHGPPTTEWTAPPEPPADEVEQVLFLVGDAGEALPGRSPVLARLSEGVESWARQLGRDSAVSVFFLGDNVYPSGVHAPGSDDFPEDSLRLLSQVLTVAGPQARRYRTPAFFLAGNHDWGQEPGEEGVDRLVHQEKLLYDLGRVRRLPLALVPRAGEPGPRVLDLGAALRVVAVDTHWWLQSRDEDREASVIREIADALASAGEREVVFVAHHPFLSGGAHGGAITVWKGLGFVYLLRKTGSLIQDLNSVPYRELRLGLRAAFAETGRPLVWAGGHDHSLQVIRGTRDDQPRWNLVSGAASKLTRVGSARGMRYGASRLGFMRLTVLESGEVHLHVFGGGEEEGVCTEEVGERLGACMERERAAFGLLWAGRLR